MSVIAEAVKHLKQDAIDRAEKVAMDVISDIEETLIKHCWDVNTAYPYPDINQRNQFEIMISKRNTCMMITEALSVSYTRKQPYFVKMSEDGCRKFIQHSKENAALQYDSYVYKLEHKIQGAVKATLEGNHVWGYSFLDVELSDGSKQTWKTQMIVNTSKHGKLFNQFPTRKVKSK